MCKQIAKWAKNIARKRNTEVYRSGHIYVRTRTYAPFATDKSNNPYGSVSKWS